MPEPAPARDEHGLLSRSRLRREAIQAERTPQDDTTESRCRNHPDEPCACADTEWHLAVPDDATAPVTAEGLRERIATIVTRWALMYPFGNYGIWNTAGGDVRDQLTGIAENIAARWGRDIAERVVAELAGDPGDLPARMAAMLRSHEWDPNLPNTAHERHSYSAACAICEGDVPRIIEVALTVRSEHTAHIVARLADAERRAEHAEGEHQVTRERLDQARRELEATHVRAKTAVKRRDDVKAERDALKAAITEIRGDAERQQRETGTTHDRWTLGVYAQASRTLRVLNRALDGGQ